METGADRRTGREEAQPFAGTILEKPWRALDERYQLDDVVRFVRHKEIPIGHHALLWYYLGGIAFFFFTVQIVTGILMLMYYEAGENASYESMKYIVGKVPFGWLIRSIHCWSAHLMVIAVVVHMFSVFFLRSYAKPREFTWMTGLGLLGLTLTFGFSGYLLPWNELSFFATSVGTDTLKSIPLIGQWMLEVLRGGTEVSIRTLYRFFALHVCILPILTFGLIALHLLLVQRQGMASPAEGADRRELGAIRFFPNFAMRDALIWVLCVNILAILAVWLPHGPGIPGMEWNLGEKADPLKPAYPGIKPEWYFLWVYQLLKEFPPHILGIEGPQVCMLVAGLIMGAWFFVPVLDRNSARGRPSPAFKDFGIAAILFLAMLTFKAWDLGAHVPRGEDPSARPELLVLIDRNSGVAVLLLGLAASAIRALRGARHFTFTAIAGLHAILHGLLGMSYLGSGGICLGLFAAAVLIHRRGMGAAGSLASLVLAAALLGGPARAGEGGADAAEADPAKPAAPPGSAAGQIPEGRWPAAFRELMGKKGDAGPLVLPKAREAFGRLPGHAQALFFSAVEREMLASPAQLDALLSLDLDDSGIELLLSDNCLLCHTNPDLQGDENLFKLRRAGDGAKDGRGHLDLREIVSDVHFRRGLMCSGCHGGTPADDSMEKEIAERWPPAKRRKVDRSWIPEFCTARCHGDADFMRRFNPGLPVDQMLKYKESKHGQLLLGKKDPKAAQCLSCHGVHGIRSPKNPVSPVHPANIPATCSRCHSDREYMAGYTLADGKTPIPTDQLEKYRTSVHGRALLEKRDLGAPACNGCHGNHAALPPEVSHISQVCRTCHVNNGSLFDGSPHKKAFKQRKWPECETCHGKHDIGKTGDEMLATGAATNICDPCHSKYGRPECAETTDFFYTGLVSMREAKEEIERDAAGLAEMGMEVDDLRFSASSLGDSLLQSRTLIHSFNRTDFSKPYMAGTALASELRGQVTDMRREYRFRRKWIIFSTLIITLFAGLLYLRIKVADARGGYRPPGSPPAGSADLGG